MKKDRGIREHRFMLSPIGDSERLRAIASEQGNKFYAHVCVIHAEACEAKPCHWQAVPATFGDKLRSFFGREHQFQTVCADHGYRAGRADGGFLAFRPSSWLGSWFTCGYAP